MKKLFKLGMVAGLMMTSASVMAEDNSLLSVPADKPVFITLSVNLFVN